MKQYSSISLLMYADDVCLIGSCGIGSIDSRGRSRDGDRESGWRGGKQKASGKLQSGSLHV